MKKYLPIVIFLLGIIVLIVVFILVKGKKPTATTDEETTLIEVALGKRPILSLIPSADGHWLKMKIEKFEFSAKSLDYEILYDVPDGRTQGVPGTAIIDGAKIIERDLLLGSESSGKFRYDEGVQKGTVTLRFRNDKGKLVAKFFTEFSLLSKTDLIASVDGNFNLKLNKKSKEGFYVVLNTIGLPSALSSEIKSGPYGLFSSSKEKLTGNLTLDQGTIYKYLNSSWSVYSAGDDLMAESIFFVGASK